MKITVETETLRELEQFAEELLARHGVAAVEVATEEVQAPAEEKPETTAESPAEAPVAEEKVTTIDANMVKHKLLEANKKTGRKVATELVSKVGYSKFSEVPAEKLPELLAMVEEVIANAAD